MAHVISDECVMCGSCEGECPVGAISEGDGKYEITVEHAKLHVRQALFQQSNYISQSDHRQNTALYQGGVFLSQFCERFLKLPSSRRAIILLKLILRRYKY